MASQTIPTDDTYNRCVSYIVNMSGTKRAITKAEIVKHACPTAKRFDEVIQVARKRLQDVYGLDLCEIPGLSNKEYIVINQLSGNYPHPQLSMKERKQQGLLLLVLAVIFMNGGAVTKDAIYNFLLEMRMIDAQWQHDYYGNVEHIINPTFTDEHYLAITCNNHVLSASQRRQSRKPDDAVVKYTWGVRAEKTVDKMAVLKFVAKMYEKSPRCWPKLYEAAGGEAGAEVC